MANSTTVNIDLKNQILAANPTTPTDIGSYITNIISAALTVAAVAAFGYLIFGGITWITAGGDEKNIEKAKSRITNAVIGLTIVAISWAIFLLLNYMFGLGVVAGTSLPPGDPNIPDVDGSGICACQQSGMCASQGAISQLSGPNDCYQCTSTGWQHVSGTCSAPITCHPC